MDPITLRLIQQRAGRRAPRPTGIRTTVRGPDGMIRHGGGGPPAPPDLNALLTSLAAGPPQRSEEDWNALLDPRMKPFIDTINQSTTTARGMNEYRFEQASAANQGLGSAFLQMLTGGKTGAEAEQYAKEQFGGSYLPAQAMQIAADTLRGLTNDFDDGDWEITGQYMQAMQQIPGIREELRSKIEQSDQQDHATKVQTASLLLDETWRLYNANRAEFEFGVKTAEERRQFEEQMGLARGELGIKAVGAATSAKNAEIRQAELGLKQAKQAYAKAKDKVSQRQAQDRINIAKGNLEVARQKAKAASKKSSGAQKAEADLAVKILTQERDTILGTPKTSGLGKGKRVGGMSYTEAYDYLYGLAEPVLTQYGRGSGYINQWVRARLRSLGLGGGAAAAKPRGG